MPPWKERSTRVASAPAWLQRRRCVLATLRTGDHVIVGNVVYGGTIRLLRDVLKPFGISISVVDARDPQAIEAAVRKETRLVIVESPANPTLQLTDIEAVAGITRASGVTLCVDNTFLTPVLQRPLELGADIVLYSTTKYFDGHNATVGGALVTGDLELHTKVKFVQNAVGFGQGTVRGVPHAAGCQDLAPPDRAPE